MSNQIRPINVVGGYAKPYVQPLPNLTLASKQAATKIVEQSAVKLTPKVLVEAAEQTATTTATKILPLAVKLSPKLLVGVPVVGEFAAVLLNAEPLADETEALKKAQQKQTLLSPSEPAKELSPAVLGAGFTGGQGSGIRYYVEGRLRFKNNQGAIVYGNRFQVPVWGTINSIALNIDSSRSYQPSIGDRIIQRDFYIKINCRGGGIEFSTHDIQPKSNTPTSFVDVIFAVGSDDNFAGNDQPRRILPEVEVEITNLYRIDGQADIDGNPPPTQQPIYSSSGNTLIPSRVLQPQIGDPQPAPLTQQLELPDFADLKPQLKLIPNLLPADQIPTPQGDTAPRTYPAQETTTEPQLQRPPLPNQNSLDTAPRIGDPAILIGSAANPGTTRITQPFAPPSPSSLPTAQQFTPTGKDRTPAIPQTPTAPEKLPTTEVPPDPAKDFSQWWTAIGLAGIGTLLSPKYNPQLFDDIKTSAKAGTCQSFEPGQCNADIRDNAKKAADNSAGNTTLLERIANQASNLADLGLLKIIDNKLGNQITGGLSGGIGRMSKFLGIDRAISLLTFLSTVHNASMLTASLKNTLLETLSSIGNATGLLETSEGDNVDLNQVFNQGIEQFLTLLLGSTLYAELKVGFRKYNAIYRSASNVLNQTANMFNSIGNALQTIGEHTGKIGNALKAAGTVGENAYQWFSERVPAKANFITRYETRVGQVTEALEIINEIAENVVESQQAAVEFQKANAEFAKELAELKKNPGVENKAVAEEVKKIKENSIKDPTGEPEKGLLSFLTD